MLLHVTFVMAGRRLRATAPTRAATPNTARASTTIVPEGEAGRFVGDEVRYNAIAARVMQRHAVAIDDLHALSARFDGKYSVAPGDVHFTPQGYERLASQVAAQIEQRLPPR